MSPIRPFLETSITEMLPITNDPILTSWSLQTRSARPTPNLATQGRLFLVFSYVVSCHLIFCLFETPLFRTRSALLCPNSYSALIITHSGYPDSSFESPAVTSSCYRVRKKHLVLDITTSQYLRVEMTDSTGTLLHLLVHV